MSNLHVRVLSAVVLMIAVLVPAWLGGVPFRLLAIVIAGAMFYEWVTITGLAAHRGRLALTSGLLALVLGLIVAGAQIGLVLGLMAGALAGAAIVDWVAERGWSGTIGLAYAGSSGLSLAMLRGGDQAGLTAILFLFAVVWTTDIAAYFVGRRVGGPKLAPAISPGKTWSGAAGGTAGGVAAGLVVAAFLAQPTGWLKLGAAALVLSIIAQIGDLFESAVKRRFGVKDSSTLIPGHGGVLDRVDGLVAAAIALYLLGWAMAGADMPAHGLFAG